MDRIDWLPVISGAVVSLSLMVLALLSTIVWGRSTEARQAGVLRIVVIEGEDAVNIIQQKTAVAPIVEVRDRNDQPVAGSADPGVPAAAGNAAGLQSHVDDRRKHDHGPYRSWRGHRDGTGRRLLSEDGHRQ